MATLQPIKEHARKIIVTFDPEEQKKQGVNEPAFRKKKVAAYARVSTEQDAQQNSYEAQISFYTDYIKNKPEWEFVGVYSDEGITGTSYKRREGFNRMVDDAKAGKIDLILTKSISRFARNTVDSLTITRDLKSHGVEVYFEKENISSMDVQAELIFTIMSSIAQEESRSISENVRWGKQRSMEAGKVSMAYGCFLGYERGPDGNPKIVEEEAEIVRDIFRRFINGESLNAIATYLNENGIRTPSNREGAIWKSGSIKRILTNEKYKGDARLQKTYVEDFLTKKVKINRGERKQWYIQDSHDAIVSPETFELAQKELARRSGRHGRFYDSPFTGKIICGDCGGLYGHRVWHSNEACRKEVWLCNGKYENGSVCQTPAITESAIIQAFLIAANRIQKRTEYCDEYEANILPLIGDTSRLDADRERLNDEKNEAIDMLEKLIDDSSKHAQEQEVFEEKRGTLELQIETKRALIETIDQQIADIRSRKENALIFIQGVRRLGNNYMIKEFDISTWHAFVDYATVMPDKSIVFHFRNGDEEVVQLEKAQ